MGGGRGIRFSSHNINSALFQMGFIHILGGLFEKVFCCFHDNLVIFAFDQLGKACDHLIKKRTIYPL